MRRTVTPIHFCTEFPFNRLRAGGVKGGCKCLGRSLFLIRSVPEYQVVGGYKGAHNRAGCVLYMVANPQLNAWTATDSSLSNESKVMTTRTTTEARSLCDIVDRAPQ
jgi:hypothetical protein